MKQRLSATLQLDNGRICCRECGHALAGRGQPWKPRATLREVPLHGDRPLAAKEAVIVLRQFCCASCGALLDSETALRGDPFLEDIVMPREKA
jgi:acetone carboxylase gamma subunit